MFSGNQGRGSSSSSPNKTTPPHGQSPNCPRAPSVIVAAGSPSPNRRRTTSPVAAGSPNRPVTSPVAAGCPSGQSSLLMFQRPQLSPQRPQGMIAPWPLAPGQGGPAGGSTGLGPQGQFGIYGVPGAMSVPVGGGAGGSPGGDRLRLGGMGSGSLASKKRGVDGPSGSSGIIGEGSAAAGEAEVHRCTLCTKTFASIKALFGHLRSHPERGYKGAHPPPKFNAQEEFRDFPGVNLPNVAQDGGQAVVADVQEVGVAQAEVVAEEEAAVVAPKPFRVLDLNDSPPSSDE